MTSKPVIPDLIGNLYKLIPIFILFVLFSGTALADSRSDFDYQYGKYRQNFLEFSLFKKDYLSTPSLDNQQKALLSTKQTINTRDLTKASFAAYVRDLILQNNLNYDPLVSINKGLVESQQYFAGEASKALTIVTLADLDNFDKDYADTYEKHEVPIKMGIVAHKIARLKNLSLQQTEALKNLKSKVSSNVSVRVTERITSLEYDLGIITEKIDALANLLISPEEIENTQSEIFFNAKVEPLIEIRSLQLDWMDKLIDLDLNYAKI